MNLNPFLWSFARALTAPFGGLFCAILFDRSLGVAVPPTPNTLGASIRLAHENDIDAICSLYADDPWLWLGRNKHDPTARSYYVDRLRRGELCYIASVEGQIAHVNWTCRTWGDALPGHPINLRPGEIYTTDALTPAPFRGRGMHMLVLGTMLNEAREHGAGHAFTLGSLDRPAALKGLHALGWREIGRIVYFVPRGFDHPLLLSRSGKTDMLFRPPA